MFEKVDESRFIEGEHEVLRFWTEQDIFRKLQAKNAGGPKWSFLDGPITANNPMGVHHAWGRTYKDVYQRYRAMTGHELRYQNGFDCQGLWVEVEVEKEMGLGTKTAIEAHGIDKFVWECKKRVLKFAARQTEQSIRLGYWMEWDDPDELRKLAAGIGLGSGVTGQESGVKGSARQPASIPDAQSIRDASALTYRTAKGQTVTGSAEEITAKLGNPEWGGSYFTFSTENNETIWTFLKKCFERGKIYMGHDVMPWSGRGGSAYSQMEVADGRRLTTHRSCFVRFPILREGSGVRSQESKGSATVPVPPTTDHQLPTSSNEYLLIWTTTPWTLTSNVAAAVNPDLDYVKLKTNRDGAIYYFAADNLEYKRLEKEFKEGFGGDDAWPDGVPKLKTISQIFKEQGGYEVLATLKGREMVGWRYAGPFDDLEAQLAPGDSPGTKSGVESHRVIDGGRDSKGNPNVVAGEGTGIVHIAPGCGDIDHKIGLELGLPIIAPLKEDGTYGEGFGPFTGREAIAPETAELVFEELKRKHLLVYVETYPHIYPHCWRTGDELVFRLVDEWFINMDWRDEIKEVTKAINWVPPSIQGQEREIEWLTTMRDWMISKKRFWGLALPIWVNPDDASDFEVIGSLAELKERAVEGWDEFEGHTPHRPWIDKVKIKSQKTGATLTRIQDVGNPWLDAGIVSFSTMHYNHDRSEWAKWYPADFITECFPGQFRNWFYSLLALATMMRYDETSDPLAKRPFKNLLGHRLVMDEHGNAMHKSDGTAIWFEEAAEQLGVDTLRWMYLAQNPASDLRFGLRHKDQPVTVPTMDGPISQTKEGLPCVKVTSTPADEVRRMVLIPLWNSYAFFVNYAILDGFDPNLPQTPVKERSEIDRWILSRLQELTAVAHESFQAYDVARFMSASATFIDDLSNWYIRRSRRRFWRAVAKSSGAPLAPGESPGAKWDADKLGAYQTLYEVLVTLTKLLAPCIPFLSERMYRNLVANQESGSSPPTTDHRPQTSVHLCEYPTVDESKLDRDLNWKTEQVQRLVRLGHRLRETAELRVRQPLAELRFACRDDRLAQALLEHDDIIADELNVKSVLRADNLDDLVSYSYKPNLKTLGPRYGKLLNVIRTKLPEVDPALLAPLRNDQPVTITLDGNELTLEPGDVMVSTQQASDWASGDDAGIQVALSTALTPELIQEGMARDLIRHVQQVRKDADLEENDRIAVHWSASSDPDRNTMQSMLAVWSGTIRTETRADAIEERPLAAGSKSVAVGEVAIQLGIVK
jgi:isoleucyl-tRNA synthetase